MAEQQAGLLAIRLEGSDETFWAQPRPEDQERIKELLRSGSASVTLNDEADVEGHGESAELTLDVEGHALTLRLPSPADAAELRRRLALGAVAATIVVAGAAAAIQGVGNAPSIELPGAPVAPAAPLTQSESHRTINDPYMVDMADNAGSQSNVQNVAAPQAQPRFVDQASDVGVADRSAQSAAEQFAGGGAADDQDGGIPKAGEGPELR